MANITRPWKKWLAVSCNHGFMADRALLRQVLDFKRRYKPNVTIHLGDCIDMTALRSGAMAPDSSDGSANIESDCSDGLAFLAALQPQHYLLGNHEARLVSLMSHPKAIVATLAARIYGDIKRRAKEIGCQVYDYKLKTGFVVLGDCMFQHGFLHSQQALQHSAEQMCHGSVKKLVMGHIHRVSVSEGRRIQGVTGYSVGYLGDPELFSYAENRIATTSWSRGFGFGEFCEGKQPETIVWLAKEAHNGTIRLPL